MKKRYFSAETSIPPDHDEDKEAGHKKSRIETSNDESETVNSKANSKKHHSKDEPIPQKVHDLSTFQPEQLQRMGHARNKHRSKHIKDNKKPTDKDDPYLGDAPIPKEKIQKYRRGDKLRVGGVQTKFHEKKLHQKDAKYRMAVRQSARTELLLTEQEGFIEPDEGEQTTDYTQHEIAKYVDVSSAEKFFELKLDKFGPYRMNYTRNGRFLLLGGARGHVAGIDWQTKKLMCEMNVMETCTDVQWLHIETMFAVAQRLWTYIYDNQGIELHCLKTLDSVLRLEFLPYHFLLVAGNTKGYLQWLDVSIGKKVAGVMTGLGRLDVMCQNPTNAIIHMGHPGGTVTLWSPNVKEPVVKMLCHSSGTRALSVTKDGLYMASSGIDRTLKIWDLRMFKLLHGYRVPVGASHLSFSQRGLLAAGMGNVVEIYKDPCNQAATSAYLTHRLGGTVGNLAFCPYEDVLGVGHARGFCSLLVPGAGEPNFDALEANPYQSKRQRQHAEVKMLLEKIQPDMINLDTSALGKVDTMTLEEKLEEKKKLLYLKPPKIDVELKHKTKGRSKPRRIEHRKNAVKEEHQRKYIEQSVSLKEEMREKEKQKTEPKKYDVLDRFTKKST